MIGELVKNLAEKGISLSISGDQLRVRGPSGSIDEQLKSELSSRKQELISYLSQIRALPNETTKTPLTASQRRLWFLDKLSLLGHEYTLMAAWRLCNQGSLDDYAQQLDEALAGLVRRHQILSYTVSDSAGEPHLTPLPNGFPGLQRVEAPATADESALLTAEMALPFTLVGGPLFRARLITGNGISPIFVLATHHIISDHASMALIIRDLSAYLSKSADALPPAPSLIESSLPSSRSQMDVEEDLAYWKTHLEEAPADIALPFDRLRPTRRSNVGAALRFSIPANAELNSFASQRGLTPFMAYLAVYARLLANISGQSDLVIGCPVSSRDRPNLINAVGFLVNTLALRINLTDPDDEKLLQQIRRTTISALEHQSTPFESIVAELRPQRHLDRNPLFQAMFLLQTQGVPQLSWPQAIPAAVEIPTMAPEVDLFLLISRDGQPEAPYTALLEYDPTLFDRETINHFAALFVAACQDLVTGKKEATPHLPISRTIGPQRLLPKEHLGERLLKTLTSSDADRILLDPDKGNCVRASVFLDHAQSLLALGLEGPGLDRLPIRIALEAGPPLAIAVTACLIAKRPFLILPPSLEDASRLKECERLGIKQSIRFDTKIQQLVVDGTPEFSAPALEPGVAYICLTSGSTGEPKAVLIPELALRNHALGVIELFQLRSQDRVLAFASPIFDVALEEIIPTLLSGACLVFSSSDKTTDPARFNEALAQRAISVVNLPAPFWHAWTDWMLAETLAPPASLRLAITGSDRVRPNALLDWKARFPHIRTLVGYGPTEATITTSFLSDTASLPETLANAPLGTPLPNTNLTVRNSYGEIVPLNCVGEIVIEGMSVGSGYSGSEIGGFGHIDADNLPTFYTGDIGRMRLDGTIEFLGRRDALVKIRGVRLHPSIIEANLEAHPHIDQAIVLAVGSSPENLSLIAFYEGAAAPSVLQEWSRKRLGPAATPSRFMSIKHLPRLTSGKIDRNALARLSSMPTQEQAPDLPRDARELRIAEAFATILQLTISDRQANFFDLGGDSLATLRLVAEAARKGLRISAEIIFQSQTVAGIAEAASPLHAEELDTIDSALPLTPILSFFHRTTGPAWRHFNQAVMIALPENLDSTKLRLALTRLIGRHAGLRIRVDPTSNPPKHFISETFPELYWREFDPKMMDRAAEINTTHACLDPTRGENVAALLFPDERRLLLVIHHLSIDVLSWPTLLEEMAQLYENPEASLPAPGTSFVSWARRLQELLYQENALPEVGFWLTRLAGFVKPLLPALDADPGLEAEVTTLRARLNSSSTRDLISGGPVAYGLSVDELLVLAIIDEAKSRDAAPLRIDLERNGRALNLGGLDISRTVGWFTAVLPLRLPVAETIIDQARMIRNAIDEQPLNGLGYGLARELGPAAPILATLPTADLLLNYIGVHKNWNRGFWQPVDTDTGAAIAPGVRRTHLLELNAGVIEGELRLEVSFPNRTGASELVSEWLKAVIAKLAHLAKSAQQKNFAGALPENCVEILPATPTQSAIFRHSRRNAATYHDQLIFSLSGCVDVNLLHSAFDEIVTAHAALRCIFISDANERLHQAILSELKPEWRQIDLSNHPITQAEDDLASLQAADRAQYFDPSIGPLQRFLLVTMPEGSWRLIWSCHHLITDGWSVSIIIEEWLERYTALIERRPANLAQAAELGDVVRAQIARAGGNEWIVHLLKDDEFPHLSDHTSGDPEKKLPTLLTRQFSPEMMIKLSAIAREIGTSWGMLIQAAWALTLNRLLDSETVMFGLPLAGRPLHLAGAERTVGMFVNTLPVRVDINEEMTSRDLIVTMLNQASERESYPHADLTIALQSTNRMDPRVPFDTLVLIQNYPRPKQLTAKGMMLRLEKVDEATEFTATLVAEKSDSLHLSLLRDPNRLSHASATALLDRLTDALQFILASTDKSLRDFAPTVLTQPPTRQQPLNSSFIGQLDRWSRLAPRMTAVVGPDRSLTYGELLDESNTVALKLKAAGVQQNDRVLLILPPSADHLVAFLAVMRAGATVCTLDIAYPEAAKSFQVKDYQPKAIILGRGVTEPAINSAPNAICLAMPLPEAEDLETDLPILALDSAAYLIYTSGSTGLPKGVFCSHKGLASLAERQREIFKLKPGDRVLQAASLAFDASVWEIALALGAGATLYIPSAGITKAGDELASYLSEQAITTATLPPPVVATLPKVELRSLHTLIVAGEVCPPDLALRWGRNRRFFNAYGPSEATICATVFEGIGDGREVPIGRAIGGVEIHITDRALRTLPDGFSGELVIGGVGIGLGYWNRPELSVERFPIDIFGASTGSRFYRTGDRARRDPDGTLHFLGRLDRQIKLRGFRIEPGEIEAHINRVEGVERTLVNIKTMSNGQSFLIAWLITSKNIDLTSLKEQLRHELPVQLVPHHLINIDTVPLTPNGKIDWARLPLTSIESLSSEYEAQLATETNTSHPADKALRLVHEIWRRTLPFSDGGPDVSFFDVGGDSLQLVKLLGLIAEVTGVNLTSGQVIANPTQRAIAARLAQVWPTSSTAVLAEEPLAILPQLSAPRKKEDIGEKVHETGAPIAIIGMSARFPGANNIDAYRRLLMDGREGLIHLSREQMLNAGADPEQIHHPNWVPVAGVLEDAEAFDAELFGMSRREATLLDPQHRVFLECSWEALESAGYPGRGAGNDCGVFAGCGMNRWVKDVLVPAGETTEGSAAFHLATANEKDFLATQTAYRLNLTGPAITIQTACSTSLVAIANAVSALRANQCTMALAGGVAIPLPQGRGYLYEQDMILSPDGHCRPFSAQASGTVPGAGAGVVLLKALDRALADGDVIHAVIRGIGLSNDGAAKMAFSAPGVEGQAAAVQRALIDAGLSKDDIDYIEAHGTGTILGDPVEVLALARVFGGRVAPLLLGSVKSMIGHCDAAAGVAGLIKTILAFNEKKLPATLHLDRLNPQIDFASGPFEVVAKAKDWPKVQRPRRAGVSSFGIGGTNAHVILEEVPKNACPIENPADGPMPIFLTGQSPSSLERQLEIVTTALTQAPVTDHARIAATLQGRVSQLPYRRSLITSKKYPSGLKPTSAAPRRILSRQKICLLLPGQGSQSPRMAESLYRSEPVFREHLDRFDALLKPYLHRSLIDLLYDKECLSAESIRDTEIAQPLVLAVSLAAARMWQSRGLNWDVLLGHSVGEISAAHLAGIMDEATTMRLIATRGQIIARQPEGAMIAVALSPENCAPFLMDGISLAAVNGPEQCVLSGPCEEIAALEQRFAEMRRPSRRLSTSHAFHSLKMRQAAHELETRIQDLPFSPPQTPIISSVTGEMMTKSEATNPAFWANQLTSTVQFDQALNQLKQSGITLGLDVGPGNILADLGRASNLDVVAAMSSVNNSADERMQDVFALASLWERGALMEAPKVGQRPPVYLPTYPFERDRLEPTTKHAHPSATHPTVHYFAPVMEALSPPLTTASLGSTLVACNDLMLVDTLTAALEKFQSKNTSQFLTITLPSQENDLLSSFRMCWKEALENANETFDTIALIETELELSSPDLKHVLIPSLRVLALVQALEEKYPGRPSRLLYLLGSGQRRHTSQPPEFAAAIAAAQIAKVENPHIDLRIVEIGPGSTIDQAFCYGLNPSSEEKPISLRFNNGFRETVQLVEPFNPDAWPGMTSGCLLVTGGFGHAGPALALAIAKLSDITVVLLGRTVREEIDDPFTLCDIDVRRYALDITDVEALQRVVQELEAEGKPVKGVIHAAGVIDWAGVIHRRTNIDLEEVWAGKVGGLLALETVLEKKDLDLFIICSTLGSFLPYAKFGQVGYASANAYLDAAGSDLSRKHGWPVRVINWDDFTEGGMTVAAARQRGLTYPAPQDGLSNAQAETAVIRVISSPYPRLAVTIHDLHKMIGVNSVSNKSCLNKDADPILSLEKSSISTLPEAVFAPTGLQSFLITAFRHVLGNENIDSETDFFSAGGHSLLAMQLLGQIREDKKINIGLADLFDAPTPSQLAKRLDERLNKPARDKDYD